MKNFSLYYPPHTMNLNLLRRLKLLSFMNMIIERSVLKRFCVPLLSQTFLSSFTVPMSKLPLHDMELFSNSLFALPIILNFRKRPLPLPVMKFPNYGKPNGWSGANVNVYVFAQQPMVKNNMMLASNTPQSLKDSLPISMRWT